MKKMKQGFTLAEVLVTLAIIGVVAAITLPNLLVNNQYKAVGTKLAKFTATTEQATRAYVAGNNSFDSTNTEAIADFINDTYLIDATKSDGSNGKLVSNDNVPLTTVSDTLKLDGTNANVAKLKDGTLIAFKPCYLTYTDGRVTSGDQACTTTELKDSSGEAVSGIAGGQGVFGTRKVGEPQFIITFDPNVGTPKSVHHNFTFVVTELGFVYPAVDESCLWEIYNNKFETNSKMFGEDEACGNSKRYKS